VLRILFYASPMLYSVNVVPANLHIALSLNPCTGMMVLARASFFPQELDGTVPKMHGRTQEVTRTVIEDGRPVKEVVMHHVNNWPYVWHSAIGIAVILTIGLFVFTRLERPMLKEI
jgi:ABC-type polysaccharide/polyol phosphate export permease